MIYIKVAHLLSLGPGQSFLLAFACSVVGVGI